MWQETAYGKQFSSGYFEHVGKVQSKKTTPSFFWNLWKLAVVLHGDRTHQTLSPLRMAINPVNFCGLYNFFAEKWFQKIIRLTQLETNEIETE